MTSHFFREKAAAGRTGPDLPMLALLLAALAAGCTGRNRTGGSDGGDAAPPSIAAGPAASSRCLKTGGPQLEGGAVGTIAVGTPAEDLRSRCTVIRDTTLNLEGEPQPALLVELGSDTVIAEIVSGMVWRLRVLTPGLRTADSIGIGTPAARLAERPGVTMATGEGRHFLLMPEHCGLSFGIRGLPDRATDRSRSWTVERIRDLPDTVRIGGILVTDLCQ